MAKPTRRFTANVGDPSTGNAGPDAIEEDLDKAFAMFDPLATLPVTLEPGGIGTENIRDGAVTDTKLAAAARRVIKGVVAYVTDLPTTGNIVGDLYLVTSAPGDVPALYVYSNLGWMVLSNAVVDYAAKFDGTTGHKHTGATGDAPPIGTQGIANGAVTAEKLANNIYSLTENGYQKLPSGLILQWGKVLLPTGQNYASVPVSFPISFNSACFAVVATGDNNPNTSWGALTVLAKDVSTTGFTILADTTTSSQSITNTVNVMYVAIGY